MEDFTVYSLIMHSMEVVRNGFIKPRCEHDFCVLATSREQRRCKNHNVSLDPTAARMERMLADAITVIGLFEKY